MADLLFKAVDLIALRAFYSKHRANISITLFKWLKLVKEVEKSHFDILRTKYVKRLYVQFGPILDHGYKNVRTLDESECIHNFARFLRKFLLKVSKSFKWRIGCPFAVNNNVMFQRFLRHCGVDFSKRFWPVVVTFSKVKQKVIQKGVNFYEEQTYL